MVVVRTTAGNRASFSEEEAVKEKLDLFYSESDLKDL